MAQCLIRSVYIISMNYIIQMEKIISQGKKSRMNHPIGESSRKNDFHDILNVNYDESNAKIGDF